ncbi:MAG: thrombospondin type 3 repeat-containing protein [Candidatus Falkowbacteria bacterium]
MKYKLLLFAGGLFWLVAAGSAQAACQASVSTAIRGFGGNVIPQAKYAIYEQIYDANGLTKPGKQLISGSTDKYTGRGIVNVPVSTSTTRLTIMIANPSLRQADFWYFDELALVCAQAATGTITLSNVYFRAVDLSTLTPQQNIKFNVYSQAANSVGEPMKGALQGNFSTGDAGDVSFYLPSKNRSLPETNGNYFLEIKNKGGLAFPLPNVQATDSQITPIDFKFSEAFFTIKDAATSNPLPGLKFSLSGQETDRFGQVIIGSPLITLTTNDQGQAYLQYPAGTYTVQIKLPSGRIQNFSGLKIVSQQRTNINLLVEGLESAKCSIKTNFKPVFRDAKNNILGNLTYVVYEQKVNENGNPQADSKLFNGSIDQYGNTKLAVALSPVKKYAMEVCDKGSNYGCYWFFNLNFVCNQDLYLSQTLPQTSIVFRNANGSLAVGQKFKVFLRTLDVDDNLVVDQSKMIGSYTTPVTGGVLLRLSPIDWQGNELSYAIVVGQKGKELVATFKPDAAGMTELEYAIKATGIDPYQPALAPGLRGRILLQIESKGEAWYVNPKDDKRYSMSRPSDAYLLMRRLGVGISSADLARIPIAISGVSGQDSDNDGLSDSLEIAIGTNPLQADSDNDGFSDYEEISRGFNPLGTGNMPIDEKFAKAQAGKILLQVDKKGEAWYVFPVNNKRYFLGKPEDAAFIMRELGLGITNKNLRAIPEGQ